MSGLLLFCLFVSSRCNKHNSPSVPSSPYPYGSSTGTYTGALDVSATRIQKGQPLIATLHPTGNYPIRWSSPDRSNMSHVTPAGTQAMYIFEQAGYYTVRAAALDVVLDSAELDNSFVNVFVSDSVYQPVGPAQDTLSLAGDQISLTPVLDSNSNLILLAQTRNTYGCFSSIVYTITTGSKGLGGLAIDFQEVVGNGSGGCHNAENPASSYLFSPLPMSKWADGNYPLSVLLNGATYTGTLTITDDAYAFSWGYTSGVTIPNLLIKK